MSDADTVLRGILAFEALCALLLAGGLFGDVWHQRGWSTRVVIVGLAGVLLYALVGQVKAFNLGIPFDEFSMVGLVAYTVLLAGLVWHWHQGRGR